MSANNSGSRGRRTVHYRKANGTVSTSSRGSSASRGREQGVYQRYEAGQSDDGSPVGERLGAENTDAGGRSGGSSAIQPAIDFVKDPANRKIVIIVAAVVLCLIIFCIVRCSKPAGTTQETQTQATEATFTSSTFAVPANGYASPALHFSIVPPDGWSVDEAGVAGQYGQVRFYCDSLPNTDGITGDFIVVRPQDATYADYASDDAIIAREMVEGVASCTVESSSDVTVGVLTGRAVTCNITYDDGSVRVMREYVLGNFAGAGVYELRYEPSVEAAADDAIYTAYVDACEASFKTFQLAYITDDGNPDETAAAAAVTTTGTPWTTAVADTAAADTGEEG